MDRLRVCSRLLWLAATLPVAACNLTSSDPPSSAHYEVTSDKPVMLITSQQFTVSGSDVALYTADTVFSTTSLDVTISLDQPPLFFIRAIPLAQASNVAMSVDIGKKNWYDANRVISPPDKLEFTYGYASGF
jgi:hypothetical protein